MKKILHFKIPRHENSPMRDNLVFSPEFIGTFLRIIKDKIGDDWVIVASPFDPTISEDGEEFFNFDMQNMTKEDLIKLIK